LREKVQAEPGSTAEGIRRKEADDESMKTIKQL